MGKREKQKTGASEISTQKADAREITPMDESYLYIKTIGEHIEAMMIALALAKMDRSKSLGQKLGEINYRKDTYYSRLDKFVEAKGLPIYDLIEDYISWQSDGLGSQLKNFTPGQLQDIFQRLESLSGWYKELGKEYRPPIRLGLSPVLARVILGPVLRNYKDKFKKEFPGVLFPEFDLTIGLSGHLRRLFDDKRLDLFVSQYSGAKQAVTLELPFCLICNADHPAAQYSKAHPDQEVPFAAIAPASSDPQHPQSKTTLVLVGPDPNRSPQFHFPQAKFYDSAGEHLRILEVDTFDRAHGLVMCDNSYVTLSAPEFLDDEHLRSLEVIPQFEHAELIAPIVLQVVREGSPNVPAKASSEVPDHRTVLYHLAGTLDDHLKRIAKERLQPADIKQFGKERWVYYVRTVETPSGWRPAWAASRLRWQFLRNRTIKGEHMVDQDRLREGEFGPDAGGQLREINQTYHILGKIEQQGDDQRWFHLHWDGIFWDRTASTPYQERYYASFICNRDHLGDDYYIAGQWNGRSNSPTYVPGGGYMIISPPIDIPQTVLARHPTKDDAATLLKRLIDRAEKLREKIRVLAKPPTKWEWQERHSPTEDES